MLKCASIFTYEIDNQTAALSDLNAQLDKKLNLMDNTIGIIMCHPEFINSGILKFVCENLPFDIVGVTTAAQAVNGEAGDLILTIFVITADDVRFKAGITDCLGDDVDALVKEAYENASKDESKEPKLAMIFPPVGLQHAGDSYIERWIKCVPKTPIFGTLAIDDTASFGDSETIFNGLTSKRNMPFVLCYGNINPRFLIGTIPEENTMPYKGEITSSTGSFVHEINEQNSYSYFESIGFETSGISSVNYLFLPFSIDQKSRDDYDGVPVIRVLDSFTDGGTAKFHGNVDEGSVFTLLKCEAQDVLSTTQCKVNEINEMDDVNGVLLFSCVVRRVVTMTDNHNEEFEIVRDSLRPDIPFMMGSAGGEICPTGVRNGIPTNRYHNYSIAILVI
ncbi:MAG: FIST C-terminal domain-containing protein [Oscillospiraceae bacterium]|nr:FIST C-terminal domain-containing protein [Oscillospiraceae bacterium]